MRPNVFKTDVKASVIGAKNAPWDEKFLARKTGPIDSKYRK
jgi:hypothetical protein